MNSMVPIQYLLRFIEEDSPFGDITSDAVIPGQYLQGRNTG